MFEILENQLYLIFSEDFGFSQCSTNIFFACYYLVVLFFHLLNELSSLCFDLRFFCAFILLL